MQDREALKYFLINLGLFNLVLVALAVGVGVLLGRLVWARSTQGLVQLRERMPVEVDRAKDAELEVEQERGRFRELREQVESGEEGTVVINSPELEEEVAVLRAEIEVMRKESQELRGERDEVSSKMKKRQGALEKTEELSEELKAKKGKEGGMTERVAALELQLLDARRERKQVEDASGVLRKELYGMRSKLGDIEKRQSLEKELDDALRDAEQRLTRLQAEVAMGAVEKRDEGEEVVRLVVVDDDNEGGLEPESEPEEEEDLDLDTPEPGKPEIEDKVTEESEEEEVVRLEVVDDDDEDGLEPESEPEEVEDADIVDDLTLMNGVGMVLAKRLKDAGVFSFRQIAELTPEDQKEMSKKLGLKNRMKSGDWQGQARELLEKHHGTG